MGSSIDKYYDDEDSRRKERLQEQQDKDKDWLQSEGEKVRRIRPESEEFRDYVWILQNTEKILRNRKLIDLLR